MQGSSVWQQPLSAYGWRHEKALINSKNLFLILALVAANIIAFFWGGYHTLTPIFYVGGFLAICVISAWASNRWQSKDLAVLALSATLLSFVDEYAHTSIGTLTYFDRAVPSLLTVFGWSVFMIFLVAASRFIANIRWLQLEDREKLRIFPVVVTLVLILAVVILQGFLNIFGWVIVLVYLLLFAASFYYTAHHSLKWNLLLMVMSLVFGFCMEYVGGMEGLWAFRFQNPVSLLILFSWPLRVWAVNALCYIVGVDFSNHFEKPAIELAMEADRDKSIIVVADTHFGLGKKEQRCDPCKFSDFLDWVESLELKGMENVNSGIWGSTESKTITIKPPEKIIFLGDILELWDASKKSIEVCTRSIIQSVSKLTCEKIYVLGNHDHDLVEIADKYPLGLSSVCIKEGEYAMFKGDKKFVFLHGHQFDKLFTLPSWRILPLINNAATIFGSYNWIFVAFLGIDISLLISVGFQGIADLMMLLLLGAISIPFLTVQFGRDVWNNLKSTKYKPQDVEYGLEKWWHGFSRKTDSEEWTVVYGHTHVIGFWSKVVGNDRLTLFNLPSWVRDLGQKNGMLLEMVFRNGFLYADDKSVEFFGWDSKKKAPFLIPKDIIQARLQNGDIERIGNYDPEKELQEIGWPQELLEKWIKYEFKGETLA
jgi:UDP-2,3-diacylglucosamine pyrophosphatase LpxH